jgi:cell division protein FtsB
MPDEKVLARRNATGSGNESVSTPLHSRVFDWALRVWRPAASVVAVALALLLGWHVVNGRNGITVWEQKRVEDRELRKEIDQLNQENARLRDHIERLKSDPDAIGLVAHDKLHYAKPNEVIVALPPDKQQQPPPAGAGK